MFLCERERHLFYVTELLCPTTPTNRTFTFSVTYTRAGSAPRFAKKRGPSVKIGVKLADIALKQAKFAWWICCQKGGPRPGRLGSYLDPPLQEVPINHILNHQTKQKVLFWVAWSQDSSTSQFMLLIVCGWIVMEKKN